MRPLKLLLLDLDDTLLDTSNLLAPVAHRGAVIAMMEAGLPGDLETLLQERLALSQTVAPDRLSRAQSESHNVYNVEVVAAGDRAYFDRDVPPIDLEAGVEEMLRRLHSDRQLVLVTSGVEKTQRQKVSRLKLEWLDGHFYAPVGGSKVKADAFRAALKAMPDIKPSEAVVIGDRLDSEIVAANQLGLWAVHVDRGEGRRRVSQGEVGRTDLSISGPLGIEQAVETLDKWLLDGRLPSR